MNERIRALRTQAAAWVSENHQPQYPNVYSQKEIDQRYLMYEEKFAELIVRQCGYYADVFESLGCPVDMDPTETKPSDYIKKHFGVEE